MVSLLIIIPLKPLKLKKMKSSSLILILLFPFFLSGQERDSIQLSLNDFLDLVKAHHPVVKQAGLKIEMADAQLLKERGAFDPKVESNYDRKDFQDATYFDILNAGLKIPTWFGLELKAKYENNSGEYLNPQNKVPENGLFAAGISVPVGQGLFINERMTSLKQARIFLKQSRAEQQLMVNEILFHAAVTYTEWMRAYQLLDLYRSFTGNAQERLRGIKRSFEAGDKPAIDTLEAGISLQNRMLNLEQAKLDYTKAKLKLGTYLWAEGNVPLEITEDVVPDINNLKMGGAIAENFIPGNLDQHPKIQSMDLKIDALDYERRLKANKLLPKLEVEYNFLSEQPEELNSLNYDEYKFGVNFSLPLFLRKERGDLRLSKLKLENANFELKTGKLELENKILALQAQLASYEQQYKMMQQLVEGYSNLLKGEERKMQLGESSVFLVNSRESTLITARQKLIEIQFKLLNSRFELLKVLVRLEEL